MYLSIHIVSNVTALQYGVSCYHLMNMCFINRWALVCKTGTEFATYYKALEEHPGEEDR